MNMLPYLVTYAGLVVFVIAVVARFFMWARMPMHLRWELYPVAHEGGGRAAYGGSYFEQSEWWTKPRDVSLLGELKVMVPEILFLVALREHNSKLWTRSFPFHFGLYLVALTTIMMMVGALLPVPALSAAIGTVAPFTGVAGLLLGLLGAVGLFLRRRSRELRMYTSPADLLNLVFFVIAFAWALATWWMVDRDFALVYGFVQNLMSFKVFALAEPAPLMPLVAAVLLSLLTAYIPLTHMSHFVGKYFAYHAIRWQDEPNLRGGKQEGAINEMLQQPVSWSAPHIQGGGKKTWLDVATEDQKK